ncbi:hypothetical protein ACFWDW_28225 [Streptomyces roseolus]|uniref:hypothetical protein n=1 Tax=Streptomyces roseolus TaxID=67358 RepID=UPI00366936A1
MTHPTPPGERTDEKALLLAAGLADLVVETIGTAAGSLRSLLGRADSADIAQDAAADLRARGRLALDRLADHDGARSLPHMELLAREAAARRAAAEAPATDPGTRHPGTDPGVRRPADDPGTDPAARHPAADPAPRHPGAEASLGARTPGTETSPGPQTPSTEANPGTQASGTEASPDA